MNTTNTPFSSDLNHQLLGVVVLYKCEPHKSSTLQTLNASCKANKYRLNLFVYDNSPTPNNKTCTFSNIDVLSYISNPGNPGVSTAYNCALKYAEKAQMRWLLLLDQDTRFPTHFIQELHQGINAHKHIKLFAPAMQNKNARYISPCKHWHNWNFTLKEIKPGVHSLAKLALINSGITIEVNTLKQLGGFNEQLPMDFSDSFVIDELRKTNCSFFLLNAICRHRLSNEEKDFTRVKSRYKVYVKSSKIYASGIRQPLLFRLFLFLRALKLSVRHADLFFIKTFFKG